MPHRAIITGLVVLLFVFVLGALAGAEAVQAGATITVTTTDDEFNSDGDCSLREATVAANLDSSVDACPAGSGDDTIIVPAGTYTLTRVKEFGVGFGEDAGLLGDLDITSTVTISGAGADSTIIDGGLIDRVIHVQSGASIDNLSGVTLQNGVLNGYLGSAIFNQGTLTMTDSTVADNTGCSVSNRGSAALTRVVVTGNDGDATCGGIHNEMGTLMLVDSRVEHNSAFAVGGIKNSAGAVAAISGTVVEANVTTGSGGGGIVNYGSMTLKSVTVVSNTANSSGGGVYNAGVLTVTDSIALSNTTGSTSLPGGGLYNLYIMTVTNSLIQDNLGGGIASWFANATLVNVTVAGNIGTGIFNIESSTEVSDSIIISNTFGGGIFNGTGGGSSSTMTVTNSLIVGNINESTGTYSRGGGVSNGPGGRLTVVNSTISGNTAYASGGGIHNQNAIALFTQLNLNNVTIAGNTADGDNDGEGDGGGVINLDGGVINLRNTLVGGNLDLGGNAPDISGTVVSQGYNLIQTVGSYTVTGDTTGNIGGDPLLGPLQDNGGPTLTHALLAGSPAIDAGNPAGCTDGSGNPLLIDQRGYARPVDGDGSGGAVCDMGAYEYASLPATPTPTPSATGGPEATGTPTPSPTPTATPTRTPTAQPAFRVYLPFIQR